MGYKLAGFDHLGGVEIDPQIADVYRVNHKPAYLYNQDIREFNRRDDLPPELYALDLLDGSPPCSTFSTSGSREAAWGKGKHFREGQAVQTLDDLVFVYCDTIIKLQPKTFVLENVTGIIKGNAKIYAKKIVEKMTAAGYHVQVFQLNAATMGVPQKRERVFFIGIKKVLYKKDLVLLFKEKPITFREIKPAGVGKQLTERDRVIFQSVRTGDKDFGAVLLRTTGKKSSWNTKIIYPGDVLNTITATDGSKLIDYAAGAYVPDAKIISAGSFPSDYVFLTVKIRYLIGMSVPPVMTAQIAHEIYRQWLAGVL